MKIFTNQCIIGVEQPLNQERSKMKIESTLKCKATASLSMEVASELQEEDKSLGDLLDEKEKKDRGTNLGRSKEKRK